nr:unnamed protein product [Digitaria exilis]
MAAPVPPPPLPLTLHLHDKKHMPAPCEADARGKIRESTSSSSQLPERERRLAPYASGGGDTSGVQFSKVTVSRAFLDPSHLSSASLTQVTKAPKSVRVIMVRADPRPLPATSMDIHYLEHIFLSFFLSSPESVKESLTRHDHHSHLYGWQAKQNTRKPMATDPSGWESWGGRVLLRCDDVAP